MPKKDINVGKSQNLIILKIFKNCEHGYMSKIVKIIKKVKKKNFFYVELSYIYMIIII